MTPPTRYLKISATTAAAVLLLLAGAAAALYRTELSDFGIIAALEDPRAAWQDKLRFRRATKEREARLTHIQQLSPAQLVAEIAQLPPFAVLQLNSAHSPFEILADNRHNLEIDALHRFVALGTAAEKAALLVALRDYYDRAYPALPEAPGKLEPFQPAQALPGAAEIFPLVLACLGTPGEDTVRLLNTLHRESAAQPNHRRATPTPAGLLLAIATHELLQQANETQAPRKHHHIPTATLHQQLLKRTTGPT